MTPKQKIRLIVVIHLIIGVVAAASILVYVFKNNLNYFYQPKEKYFNTLAGIIFSLSVIL